jgi:hypothetical protein
MKSPVSLSLKTCYAKAWKSFAAWWIPICLLSGFLILFELGPRQLARAESSAMRHTLTELLSAIEQGDLGQVESLAYDLNEMAYAYAGKMMKFTLCAAPFVAILGVVLICTSLMAVKDRRRRYAPLQVLGVSLVHLILAVAKVLLLFVFFPLGLYVYVKLYFTSLLMLEEGLPAAAAIRGSWRATGGNFWPLFGMIAINGTLQFAMVPTLIGLIPATGFANTVRAAAFTELRQDAPASG